MESSGQGPSAAALEDFVVREGLPDDFHRLIERCYLPLTRWVEQESDKVCPLILGISGAQGTGKSTLARFIRHFLEAASGCTVATLSLDDFYLTRAERHHLGMAIHPLLATRGVPGTHDLQMLTTTLEQLRLLRPGDSLALPRFDKSQDDRADPASWPVVHGPVDVVVLEGWCIGIAPQPADELARAVNALERVADAAGIWRRYVNEQLAGDYATLFARINRLIYLRAPGFGTALRWRTDQEHRLAEHLPKRGRSMSDPEVARFVRHFERLTRAALAAPPERADVIVELDDQHACSRLDWRPSAARPVASGSLK